MADSDIYKVTTTRVPTSPIVTGDIVTDGCSDWIWIILLVIAILVIIGLVIWLIFAYRRHCVKDPLITLNNPTIQVSSPNSLTATWSGTSSTDVVTLCATEEPARINSDGSIANTRKVCQTAAPGATTVTVNNLTPNVRYYATLVATNPNTVNYQVYTQIIYNSSPITPPVGTFDTNTFAIEHIIQPGRIQVNTTTATNDIFPVQYVRVPGGENTNTAWFVTTNSQIASATQDSSVCLFRNGTNLAARDCTSLSASAELANSQWTYNPAGFPNHWCLTSTLRNDVPDCMVLGSVTNTGQSNISVGASEQGDSWITVPLQTIS